LNELFFLEKLAFDIFVFYNYEFLRLIVGFSPITLAQPEIPVLWQANGFRGKSFLSFLKSKQIEKNNYWEFRQQRIIIN